MRIWFKTFKDNRMICDLVVENDSTTMSRTNKIMKAVETCCYEFDLCTPIWLDSTIKEFQRHAKARFLKDNFVETIDFDYLEIHVIEED
ncbi:MAG: hypothetical protein ACRC7V_08735 [Lachnospiraceae bacterium]